jgi:hypothetical protein
MNNSTLTFLGIQLVDLLTISISFVAFLISLYTLYKTVTKGFHVHVVPTKRLTLTTYSGIQYLLIPVEFINTGARTGVVDDLIVVVTDCQDGTKFIYVAAAAREKVDIFVEEGQPNQYFQDFDSVWLLGGESKQMYVLFNPKSGADKIKESLYAFNFVYTYDNSHDQIWLLVKIRGLINRGKPIWKKGDYNFRVEIKQSDIDAWNQAKTVRIDSIGLIENRKLYFDDVH